MGSYLAADRITAARTSGAQHRSMNPAPSLEQAADAFLTDAERRQPAPVDIWAAAAGLYGTEGDDGDLAWQAEALCAQTDPEAFFPEKGGSTGTPKGCAVYAPYAKSVYNMQWTMTSASVSGAVCQNENAADYASRRAKPGRYNPHADCATVLPPNLPTRGDRHPPLLLRGLHRNHR